MRAGWFWRWFDGGERRERKVRKGMVGKKAVRAWKMRG
jgi:hypothetical protein